MLKYWYLIIIALILATLLWFVAWGLATDIKEIKGVGITVENLKSELAYSLDTYEVDIKIVGKKKDIELKSKDDFVAVLDLEYWEKGTYDQKVEIKNTNRELQVIEVSPEMMSVRIEDEMEREVEIEGMYEGVPATDYLAGTAKISPEKAKAVGPKSEIENLSKATARIKLNGEKENFSREIALEAVDNLRLTIRSITFQPEKVRVEIFIFSGSDNKAIGIKPRITGVPLAGFWVSGVSTSPSTIIINSSGKDISEIDYIETTLYDINGIKENKEDTVGLVFPPGVVSVENIKEVKIRIELFLVDTTRELFGSVGIINLETGRRVTRLSPDTIRVVVSGPSSIVRALTSSDVLIEVDASGKGAGTHRIELKKENIKVPTLIGVVSFLPNVIEVTIE